MTILTEEDEEHSETVKRKRHDLNGCIDGKHFSSIGDYIFDDT